MLRRRVYLCEVWYPCLPPTAFCPHSQICQCKPQWVKRILEPSEPRPRYDTAIESDARRTLDGCESILGTLCQKREPTPAFVWTQHPGEGCFGGQDGLGAFRLFSDDKSGILYPAQVTTTGHEAQFETRARTEPGTLAKPWRVNSLPSSGPKLLLHPSQTVNPHSPVSPVSGRDLPLLASCTSTGYIKASLRKRE